MNELVVPYSGELVDLSNPPECLNLLKEIRELEQKLRLVKGALTDALVAESSRQGTKTLELNGIKAVISASDEIVWDVEVLQELLDLGLPEERLSELITTEVTYKVNASVARQLAGANSAYAEVIERAKSRIPKTPYVSIKNGKGF